MVLLYITIPIMILAIGIATVPLLWAMHREEQAKKALALAGHSATDGRVEVDAFRRAA